MANNTEFVTFGKPKVAGSIYAAPIGTEIPNDATSQLNEAFKSLGYVSEDGLTNSNTPDTDVIKAWGGDTVLTVQTGKEDTFSFKLIESLNVEVLKLVYGSGNVTGTLETGIVIKANAKPLEDWAFVIEMIAKNNVLKRIVIPVASISEIGEITYSDEDAVGYEVTLNATPDTTGNTHYEYIQKSE